MSNLRIPVILVVFISVLTLFLVGQHFLFDKQELKNLKTEFMNIDGVQNVMIERQGRGHSVTLVLVETRGLEKTYEEILTVAQRAGIPPSRITLKDNRGPRLSRALYRIHFSIQEAMATGHFQEMARVVEATLADEAIDDYRLWVDAERIYLEMHSGPEHLYEIFPRYEKKSKA